MQMVFDTFMNCNSINRLRQKSAWKSVFVEVERRRAALAGLPAECG